MIKTQNHQAITETERRDLEDAKGGYLEKGWLGTFRFEEENRFRLLPAEIRTAIAHPNSRLRTAILEDYIADHPIDESTPTDILLLHRFPKKLSNQAKALLRSCLQKRRTNEILTRYDASAHLLDLNTKIQTLATCLLNLASSSCRLGCYLTMVTRPDPMGLLQGPNYNGEHIECNKEFPEPSIFETPLNEPRIAEVLEKLPSSRSSLEAFIAQIREIDRQILDKTNWHLANKVPYFENPGSLMETLYFHYYMTCQTFPVKARILERFAKQEGIGGIDYLEFIR